jgi:hypothetical protein
MPTPTHIALGNLTLSATDAEVTFASIPNTYRDLILVARVQGTNATGGLTFQMRLNGDSGNNYSDVVLGSSSGGNFSNSTSSTNGMRMNYMGSAGTETSVFVANILDYSATDKHKSVLTRSVGTADGSRTDAFVGRWANTGVVTSVTIRPDANSIAAGSTFALYGRVS